MILVFSSLRLQQETFLFNNNKLLQIDLGWLEDYELLRYIQSGYIAGLNNEKEVREVHKQLNR